MQKSIETIKHNGYTAKIYHDSDPMNPYDEIFCDVSQLYEREGSRSCWSTNSEEVNDYIGVLYELINTISGLPTDKMDRINSLFNFYNGYGDYDLGHYTALIGKDDKEKWDSFRLELEYIVSILYNIVPLKGDYETADAWLVAKNGESIGSMAQEMEHWADGEVYGFIIKDRNGHKVDSCWGFYGLDYITGYVTESIKRLPTIKYEEKQLCHTIRKY